MAQAGGTLTGRGNLKIKVTRGKQTAPLSWTLRNRMRRGFIRGQLAWWLAPRISRWLGIVTIVGRLEVKLIRDNGEKIDYGVVGYRVITDVGVGFLVDDWDDDTTDITTMNFHGCGTTGTAEDQTDTALAAESTTVLNPDSTRATGTKSQPAANQLQSVGTLTFDGSAAVVEHGLFNLSGTGTGVLWDRTVFSVINVANLDSIQFTYTATLTANG